jgi:hypothetical protein
MGAMLSGHFIAPKGRAGGWVAASREAWRND